MRDRERETEMVWHDGVTRGERMEVKVSDACSHRKDSSQMRSFRYASSFLDWMDKNFQIRSEMKDLH